MFTVFIIMSFLFFFFFSFFAGLLYRSCYWTCIILVFPQSCIFLRSYTILVFTCLCNIYYSFRKSNVLPVFQICLHHYSSHLANIVNFTQTFLLSAVIVIFFLYIFVFFISRYLFFPFILILLMPVLLIFLVLLFDFVFHFFPSTVHFLFISSFSFISDLALTSFYCVYKLKGVKIDGKDREGLILCNFQYLHVFQATIRYIPRGVYVQDSSLSSHLSYVKPTTVGSSREDSE